MPCITDRCLVWFTAVSGIATEPSLWAFPGPRLVSQVAGRRDYGRAAAAPLVKAPAECGLDCAALAAPPPAAMPAIIVIAPTAMAILVVHRIRTRVPFAVALFPALRLPRKPSQEGY